ncbi:G-D-S-L family lipolytic protein [Christiangramia fulva]|uniref:G-D-S-L family lipolytic protein n=1 Tax=Christiangramia fulva TaxID=2126553 RepID=A0A2R3Z508_9FLAO|nr:G-D-S-L family lipolytic protein [Christiangramia fulva]AVR45350.1 G-D-S-L family lipolytic protein [Christiangramia fulva]
MKKYILLSGLLALGLVSCEPELRNSIEEQDFYTSGTADFSHYVALGNSLTAGYADGALYISGQMNSYPSILAQKFALVQETDEFTQPLVSDNFGGLLYNGNPIKETRYVLSVGADGPMPVRLSKTPTTEVTNRLEGSFGNMGVPGAKSFHLIAPGYGNMQAVAAEMANPYFARFASSDNTTVLADALAQNPTFFTLWIGNNDVLNYATSGGAGIYQKNNTDFTTYGENDITDPNAFAYVYDQIVSKLAGEDGANADGVLIGIPQVSSIPFFNLVPPNPIPLDAQTVAALNAKFGAYNTQILPGLVQAGVITQAEADSRKISFTAGEGNFVTIVDEDLTALASILMGEPFNLDAQTAGLLSQLRQANSTDLIPLTSASFIGTTVNGNPLLVNGVSVPLADQYVLTFEEQQDIVEATTAYNAAIKSIADAYELGYVDSGELLNQLNSGGIAFDGGTLTSTFVTGGAFSLDGVHLTPRGYALLANKIIAEINTTYNAEVPKANVGEYPTVTLDQNL